MDPSLCFDDDYSYCSFDDVIGNDGIATSITLLISCLGFLVRCIFLMMPICFPPLTKTISCCVSLTYFFRGHDLECSRESSRPLCNAIYFDAPPFSHDDDIYDDSLCDEDTP